MNSIVISIGGLHVSSLGCYGSGWIETPIFDRFAAEGFAFDQCLADTPLPYLARCAWWSARYQCFHRADAPDRPQAESGSLITLLRAGGVRTILIRDTRGLLSESAEEWSGFDCVIELQRNGEDSTEHVFAAALQWLEHEAARGSFLLFLDCHGAHPPWYPPPLDSASGDRAEFSEDEQEIDEHDSTEADAHHDSDAQESNDGSDTERQIYAAVISKLDDQLGAFLDFLRAGPTWQQSLVIVTSDLSALPGDARNAGTEPHAVGEAGLHVPLVMRMSGTHDPASRGGSLVQSIDLLPTVCDALGVAVPSKVDGRSLLPILRLENQRVRDQAFMGNPGRVWAIRTSAWHMILQIAQTNSDSPAPQQLFIKPDDRWERNDVAKQYPDVVEELERTLLGMADAE